MNVFAYLVYFAAFIFVLGAVVILHEFGHFIVAKLFKIRVETFSVGFGTRLFGKKWGHTDYRVSLIPLGGYVKLGGDESNAPLEGEGAKDIPPEEMYNLRPRWQRVLVSLAGPVMNILTALAIPFAGALLYGVPATPSPVISYVKRDGAAEVAGLKAGDRITSFNGTENPRWDLIRGDALLSPGQPLPITVERDGQVLNLTIKPTPRTEDGDTAGFVDFIPDYGGLPVLINKVTPGSPAEEAGLQVGDRVSAINGESVRSAEHVTQFVKDHRGQPITLRLERGGQTREVTTQSRRLQDGLDRLGIETGEEIPFQRASLGVAGGYAVRTNVELIRLTGKALGQLFSGQRSVRNTISGPIGIYRAAATSVERFGWGGLFQLVAFLSLNLGIFNLLPIPVLDGGAIFLLLIEGLLALVGLSISMAVRERIQQVGFVMVILLMVFVITNDLLKTFSSNSTEEEKPAVSTPAK
jgi:regulator of sigma E protease